MPSDFQSPFADLDYALCKTLRGLDVNEDGSAEAKIPPRFQRAYSACPMTLSASRGGGSEHRDDVLPPRGLPDWGELAWPLPRTPLQHIPFRTDRSVSVSEGSRGEAKVAASRYKTELCRTFEESGLCKYGAKCQYAHGAGELRELSRHPKYKTEPCRTFHNSGMCPYGARCHFIHNAEERRPPPPRNPQPLGHSLSSGGCAGEALPSSLPALAAPAGLHLPEMFFPSEAPGRHPLSCSRCTLGFGQTAPASCGPFAFPSLLMLQKSFSADSLSDQEDSGSSGGSSDCGSPRLGRLGRRLPIFSQLSVSDD